MCDGIVMAHVAYGAEPSRNKSIFSKTKIRLNIFFFKIKIRQNWTSSDILLYLQLLSLLFWSSKKSLLSLH